MLSRRKFLQTNVATLALPLARSSSRGAELDNNFRQRISLNPTAAESGISSALPQPSQAGSHPQGAAAKRDYWNDWPLYLTAKVNEARARRKAALGSIRSKTDVGQRIFVIQKKVWDMIGGPFQGTPLKARTVGKIERKSYRIEKVIFESQPQVHVTAHLYVPAVGKAPFPGILAPLGHAPNGKSYRNYQLVYQTLARKGYVVLAYDPFGQGERQQYLDPRTGRSRFGPTGEHSQAGRPLLLLGATFAQYRVWDGIRALDYLASRPEVDPERIGCTGHSGGGTMTMYLCALEPRIRAAVEVQGNSENFAGPDYDPPGAVADAEQNLVGSLPAEIDRGDLLWAFAPRPLLVCYTPLDAGTTYSPVYSEGTREIYEELKAVFGLLGAQEKVELFASPLPHDFDFFTRRATYAWFNRWLGNIDWGTDEAEFDMSSPDELNCTNTGQVLTSLGGRSVLQVNIDRSRAVMPASPFVYPSRELPGVLERIRATLRRLLSLPWERSPLQAAVLSANTREGLTIEEIEFRSEPEIRVPGWFIKPSEKPGPLPTVIYVSQEGKDRVVEEPSELEPIVRRGFALCAIDLRGLGLTAPRYPAGGPIFYGCEDPDFKDAYPWASLTLGKPLLGQRVWDFLRCLDYLEARPDVNRTQIFVYGRAGAGCAALLGTALDKRPRSLLLERGIADFRSVIESEDYSLNLSEFVFGWLREFDLPDVLAAVAPRPCWMLNARGPRDETLSESTMRGRYKAASDFYTRVGARDGLRFFVQPDQERQGVVLSWLGSS